METGRKSKIIDLSGNGEELSGNGSRKLLLSGKETGGSVYLVEGIMNEGDNVPPHVHTLEDEIFHVVEGEVILTIGERTEKGSAGQIFYLPRNIPHSIRNEQKHEARVLNYVIPGKNFENFFQRLHQGKGPANDSERDAIEKEFGITFL